MGAASLRDIGFQRYITASRPDVGFNASLDGGKVLAWTSALALLFPRIPVGRGLGTRFKFMGVGANNSTFDYRIWGLTQIIGQALDFSGDPLANPMDDLQYVLDFLGSGTATLSALTGTAAGVGVLSTERIADTLTFTASTTATTPKGPMSVAQTAYNEGTAGVYSPADDTAAMLMLPHLIRYSGLIIDFDPTGATSANALVSVSSV